LYASCHIKHITSHKTENIQKFDSLDDIVLQPAMDIIKEESDLGEGTSQLSTLKEETLVDIKYEDNYDPISSAIFVSPEMVS
jgi:predicted transglutaminase-like protease